MAQVNLTGSRARVNNPAFETIKELVRRYNAGELSDVSEKDLEQISILAAQYGIQFDVASKPIRKGLFDLADTAMLGLLPNKWRPESIGQEWHGESGVDKFAGGVGTLGGLGVGLYGGYGFAKGFREGFAKHYRNPFSGMPDFTQPWRGNIFGRSGGGATSGGGLSGPVSQTSTRYLPFSNNKLALLNKGRDQLLIQANKNYLPWANRVPRTPGMSETVDIFNIGMI